MGREKYIRGIEEFVKKSPLVDARSISQIIKDKKKIKQYDKQLIRNLLKSGKLKRLAKGFYTTHDDPSLAVLCFKPAYLGLQDALAFHGLIEQETIPVVITSRRARPGIREIMGTNVLIRRLDNKYLFGFEYHQVGGFYLPVSDPEKTVIDMLYFKESLDIDFEGLDKEKLLKYLKKYPKKFRERVLRKLEK
jgi:predicted transcriptional regulator of viral defense system